LVESEVYETSIKKPPVGGLIESRKCSQAFFWKGKNCSQAIFAAADLHEVANTSRSFRIQYHVLAFGLQLVQASNFYSVRLHKKANMNSLDRNSVVFPDSLISIGKGNESQGNVVACSFSKVDSQPFRYLASPTHQTKHKQKLSFSCAAHRTPLVEP